MCARSWNGAESLRLLLCAGALVGFGCTNEIGGGGESGGAGDGQATGSTSGGQQATGGGGSSGSGSTEDLEDLNGVGPTTDDLTCDQDGPLSESPLLKLSTVQYRNTVNDLLNRLGLEDRMGEVDPLLAAIPNDSLGDSFRGMDDRIAIEHVQGFFNVGVLVGDSLAGDSALLADAFGDCATEEPLTDACWTELVTDFITLVHRRPPSDAERALYDALRADQASGVEAIRALVIVALSSPRFLYHVEIDGEDVSGRSDLIELEAYAVASRLSYTFWQTMPDEELMAAAEDGSLLEADTYEEQLARVWGDPRTEATIAQFYNEWLKMEKFTGFETSRPAFQALTAGENFGESGHDYYADMVQEVLDLTDLFTFEQPGTLADLLRTNVSVTQSADLASLYEVEVWDGASDYPELENRAGLLQRAALLVSNLEQTNPFHRGALVRRAILCEDLPQPDPNSLPAGSLDPPPIDEAQTTRERFNAKVEGNGLCETCHSAFSNIGYVMEAFDAVGRYRTMEKVFDEQTGELLAELPIDATAQVNIASLDEPEVSGPGELNELIVSSGKVEACLAKSYLNFAFRRATVSSSLDACVIEDLQELLSSETGGLASAFRRVAEVPTFFTRKVGAQ